MATPIAQVASSVDGGFVRVVSRYPDNTTRTVLIDPETQITVEEGTGTAKLDDDGEPTATWWNP